MGRLKTILSSRPARLLLLCWRTVYPLLVYMLAGYLALYGGLYACAIRYGFFSGERENALARAYGTVSSNLLLVTSLAALLALPLLLFFLRRDRRREQRGAPMALPLAPLAAALLAGGGGFAYSLNFLMDRLGLLEMPSFQEAGEVLYGEGLLIQLLGPGMVIPLVEELVFRGLAFSRLRRKMGFWPAALISALIFGTFHGNLTQGIYAFLLGLLIAWVYERTGRFWTCVLFHAAANLLSILASNFTDEFSIVLAVACGAAAVAGSAWIGQKTAKRL